MKQAGVDSYMIKPVSLAQLGADVARLLGQSAQKQQRENAGSVTAADSG